ncbi:MAG: GatB/YqeY domain-containing protein [Patescibacteria group bacterium]
MLHQKIKGEIKQAMMDKNAVKLGVVRSLVAAFTNELVAKNRKPDEFLADEEVLAVIQRSAKQRKDSIAQFREAGRNDLVEVEEAELEFVEVYLPTMMSETEVETAVKAKMAELGISTKADSGKLMSALMKDLKGKADGMLVKSVTEKLLV